MASLDARQEETFRLLVDSVQDYAIFLLDPEGYVQTWNKGAARLKGYDESEIVGEHFSRFYPDADRERGLPLQLLGHAVEHGTATHAGWRVRKDGTEFWADVLITALFDEGDLVGFAKVTRDLTERHRAQEELEESLARERETARDLADANERSLRFIASVVHDLRTPTTAILGFVDLLAEDLVEEEDGQRQHMLDRIRSNAQRLNAMVQELLEFSRLEAGQTTVVPVSTDLAARIAGVLDDLAPVLKDHPVELDVLTAEVEVDPHALDRIIENLLGNAAKFSPPGSPIRVVASATDGAVRVSVADRGPGVPEEQRERIFESFHSGSQGGPAGAGIGLAVVRHYVRLHGGDVGVSEAPGGGADFWFTLPVA